ncbi:MAG TPA: GFA family protein [Kiloniellales bacterium]
MAGSTASGVRATGRCLCGAVAYRVHGPLRDVVNCHCQQCRRTHGHTAAYSRARRVDLVMTETRGLTWYRSSETARRGFCRECGASLFWDPLDGDSMAIAAGSIDAPTGLKTIRHIFVADKGDYYDIADGLEQLLKGHTPS